MEPDPARSLRGSLLNFNLADIRTRGTDAQLAFKVVKLASRA
jgi:hypothetical protein